MYDKEIFGTRLKQARKDKEFTQDSLACAAGVSKQIISGYENGKANPNIDTAVLLAEKLNVSLDFLCGLRGEEKFEDPNIVKNYANLLNLLSIIGTYLERCNIYTEKRPRLENERVVIEYDDEFGNIRCEDEPDKTVAIIESSDYSLIHFVEQWEKMRELSYNGQISDEIMNTWYSAVLAKMEKIRAKRQPNLGNEWFGIEPRHVAEQIVIDSNTPIPTGNWQEIKYDGDTAIE